MFPTAVDEESLEAAKERSQKMFLTKDWGSGGLMRGRRSARIVSQRANEW